MFRKNNIYVLCLIIIMILLISCAAKRHREPYGGDYDRELPEIISITPKSGSKDLGANFNVKVSFNDYLRGNITRYISIYPVIANKNSKLVDTEDGVEIYFKDLPESLTVMVDFSSSTQDWNGNYMGENQQIGYSTGGEIDSLQLISEVNFILKNNVIFVNKSKNICIDLIPSQDIKKNGFLKASPFYHSKFGKQTKTSLKYLADGNYLTVCYDDKNNNQICDFQKEAFSLGESWLFLKDSSAYRKFVLVNNDKEFPVLENLKIIDRNLIELKFNEILDTKSLPVCKVMKDDSIEMLVSPHLYRDRVLFNIDSLEYGNNIKCEINNIKDLYGNCNPFIKEQIFYNEFDNDNDLKLKFKPPKIIEMADSFYFELNKCNKQKLKVELKQQENSIFLNYKNICGKIFQCYTDNLPFISKASKYKIYIYNDRDTLYNSSIEFSPHIKDGFISGKITGNLDEKYYLIISDLNNKEIPNSFTVREQEYKISKKPGIYFLALFQDLNHNGYYDGGNITNVNFSEKLFIYQDTVVVKENWETTGVDFNIGE